MRHQRAWIPSPETADTLQRRGLMFILSSPSGAGKTTIARMLLEQDDGIALSVSVTTRPMRPGEVDGRDYHFVTQAQFDEMVADEHFFEWATVFGHSYGTPKAPIKAGLREGRDFLFDVDWQGTQQLYQRAETDVVRVFILPPSLAELQPPPDRARHRQRGSHRRPHGPRPGRDQPLGRLRLRRGQRRRRGVLRQGARRSSQPSGCAARARPGWSPSCGN